MKLESATPLFASSSAASPSLLGGTSSLMPWAPLPPWTRTATTALAALLCAGCASTPHAPSVQHLHAPVAPAVAGTIPPPVALPALPPKPRAQARPETYSVVVSNVNVSELLFALARDAKLNVDIHPRIMGTVTLNAIDQTLPQILTRLSNQVDMRYEIEGNNLVVLPDTPYLRRYKVDYVNLARDTTMNVSVATQVATTGQGAVSGSSSGGGGGSNNSTTQLVNRSNNHFWTTLAANVRALLYDPEREVRAAQAAAATAAATSTAAGAAPAATAPAAAPASASTQEDRPENSPVIANPESGVLLVRATSRQHAKVQEFLDQVLVNARRQVMIEATVVEVQLSEQFQQGINWQRIRQDGTGWTLTQQPMGADTLPSGGASGQGPGGVNFPPNSPYTPPGSLGGATIGGATPSMFVMRFLQNSAGSNLSAAVSLLESFGKVKVLSSPKLSVLNNQTALLKVVDNRIYFNIELQITPATDTSAEQRTYTTTINSVPVGFVMSVTPQIDEHGVVTMNVRPTISRIIGYAIDPNPDLARVGVQSRVPEIQTRELESMLKVSSGSIAVMGGLMQDSIDNKEDGIPGLQSLPWVGEAFKYKNRTTTKNELVIFLRPVVIRDASLEGDYGSYGDLMPTDDFFRRKEALEPARPFGRLSAGEGS